MKKITYSLLALVSVVLLACGGGDHESTSTEEEGAVTEESHEGHDHATEEGDVELPPPNAPEGARVLFTNIEDGQPVMNPIMVHMQAEGINVHPAGELLEGTGHHHVIIDGGPTPLGEVVPADETHLHFGGGQIETELNLEPGPHTLTLQFADGLHRSYGEALSATIQIQVEVSED